jgi:hypothetical protein
VYSIEASILSLAAICRAFATIRTGFAGNSGSSASRRTE